MDELTMARQEICRVDEEIARLFGQRMAAVGRVAAYKQAHGLPVLDPAQEQRVLARGGGRVEDPVLRGYYLRLLQLMMDLSKEYQARLLQPQAEPGPDLKEAPL